jgi:V/A-type H+-transporting ATPase subunit I
MILFFGICFGDAGYGLVFFLLSWWTRKKWGEKVKGLAPAMRMCEFFAISTMAVGLITGSVFGYNFVNRDWIMLDVSIGAGDPMILFYVSLGLGVLHLSVSYILGMMDSHSSQDRLQKLGVMFVLWGGVSLVSRVIWFSGSPTTIGTLLYYAGAGFLSLGILLTLLFATDNKNWGIRLGLGLWNVYGLSGLVGDLLSYARLFGLGMATSAIASVMNQLGMMVKDSMGLFLGTFFAIILIILGHVFNFALSVLGSVVHSARLHFVEAFKSFFQGGGIEYKPFKIERG